MGRPLDQDARGPGFEIQANVSTCLSDIQYLEKHIHSVKSTQIYSNISAIVYDVGSNFV